MSHVRNEIKHSDFVNFVENKHKSVQAQARIKIDSNKQANKRFEIMLGDYNQTCCVHINLQGVSSVLQVLT